mmetsp:Transcript_19038/g.62058  ORF Transcript_19038/g.62058 Transcript_19038/m.62058 type:complete len:157 (+) Transcript_19038:109-579(+)
MASQRPRSRSFHSGAPSAPASTPPPPLATSTSRRGSRLNILDAAVPDAADVDAVINLPLLTLANAAPPARSASMTLSAVAGDAPEAKSPTTICHGCVPSRPQSSLLRAQACGTCTQDRASAEAGSGAAPDSNDGEQATQAPLDRGCVRAGSASSGA